MQKSCGGGSKTRNDSHLSPYGIAAPQNKAANYRRSVLRVFAQLGAKITSYANSTGAYNVRPLIVAFSICLGTSIYFALPFEPQLSVVIAALFLALALLYYVYRRNWSVFALCLIVSLSMLSGIGLAKLKALSISSGFVNKETRPIMIEGWVSAVEPSSSGVRLRILTHAVEGMTARERPREVRLTHRASLMVSPGRFVRCLAVIRPPPGPSIPGDYNFRRQAWFEQLHGVGYVQGRCRGGTLGSPSDTLTAWRVSIASKRRELATHINEVIGNRAGGFAAALVSGDRSFMRPEDRAALREAGLAHLLAISGLHMGIVCGLVYLIAFKGLARIEWLALRVPLQKPAAIIALVSGVSYLIMSGASVSTQRALIMAALVFIAVLINRNAISLRTYAIAMIVVIALQPDSVMGPGFQMSFAATGVLIAIYETWRDHRTHAPQGFGSKQVFAMKSLVVTSVAAGLATSPYALFHFDRVATYGIFANLLAMPIITFVSAPSAALSLLLLPFGLAEYGLRAFGWSLELVLSIAHWNASMHLSDGPQLKPMPASTLLLFSVSIGCFILFKQKARIYSTLTLIGLALIVWTLSIPASVLWSPSGDVFIWQNQAYRKIVFADGEGLAPLSYKELRPSGYCKKQRCVVRIANKKLLLIDNDDQLDCSHFGQHMLVLSASPQNKSCPNIISLDDVDKKGGAAIWIGGSANKIKFADICGLRPWQPECNN